MTRNQGLTATFALAAVLTLAAQTQPAFVADPAAYVDTRIGTANGGNVFPGAVLPFGMLAWSPEQTTVATQGGQEVIRATAAGGYQYNATRVRGYSLTHLSGTGCRGAPGDIPFMPITVPVSTSPSSDAKNETYGADLDHATETGAAGYYQSRLSNGVNVELTATTRAGMAQFSYPAGQPAAMLVRSSDSQVGSSDAHIAIDAAARTITGSVTSGNFCGYIGTVNRRSYYTLYFVAVFDRPFATHGTWQDAVVSPGKTSADGGTTYGAAGHPVPGKGSGAWVGFESAAGSTVHVRVGISYVSLANARANLDAEVPASAHFDTLRQQARNTWNTWLKHVEIGGGTETERKIFYTALYHASMHLNVASDVNGEYAGFDGKPHKIGGRQRAQFANFSGWDVSRSQLMLVSLRVRKLGAV